MAREFEQTPPGDFTDHFAPAKAPVVPDRSFLVSPTDKLTGLPLPIAPVDPKHLPQYYVPRNHHHHFHPENSPLLQTTAGLAVRHSRVQYVRMDLHDRYHQLFAGPPLPDSEKEAFRIAVLAAAGVVPRQAIDLSVPGKYRIVTLNNNDYYRTARYQAIHPDKKKKLSRFFAIYATQQELTDSISDGYINEFIDPKTSPERKLELARDIFLADAVELSLGGVAQEHHQLRREGLVIQQRKRTAYSVVRRFIRQHALRDFSQALSERFAVA